MSSLRPINPTEMLSSENWNTELKRKILNMIKEFKDLTRTESHIQESANTLLNEVIIQTLKTEFSKEKMEILKKNSSKNEDRLKNSITQLREFRGKPCQYNRQSRRYNIRIK